MAAVGGVYQAFFNSDHCFPVVKYLSSLCQGSSSLFCHSGETTADEHLMSSSE